MTNYPQWARKLAAKMALDGVQQVDVARHYGVTRQYVSAVMSGRAKSADAATEYITAALDAIRAERGSQ